MNPSRLLLIDAGHSRIKFHSYAKGQEPQHLAQALHPFRWPKGEVWTSFTEVILIGTHDRMNERLSSHISQHYSCPLSLLEKDLRVPIERVGKDPRTGRDRLLNAFGAQLYYPHKKVLIISAGTALVIDAIDERGRFLGGTIGLGFDQYKESMLQISPVLESTEPKAEWPCTTTEAAVSNAWMISSLESIQNAYEILQADHLLLTGGDAQLLQTELKKGIISEHLGANALAQHLGYFKT